VGVTHHLALWSPDVPRHLRAAIVWPTHPCLRLAGEWLAEQP
jgi:hypothetical protein